MAVFSVDWEDYNHALHIGGQSRIVEPTLFILDLLDKYNVKAIFYILGRAKDENPGLFETIKKRGHKLGWHGQHHDHHEMAFSYDYRSPYWDTTPMPWPPAGGFFFRFMPYSYVKWATEKSGMFWLHPHDVMENHPKLKSPFLNWKRNIGLKTARAKLDKLISEVSWNDPQSPED